MKKAVKKVVTKAKSMPHRSVESNVAKKVIKKAAAVNPVVAVEKNTNESGIMPLGDRVLVKPLSPEETGKMTSFGIIIPETVGKEKPEQGTVIAVGPGKVDDGERVPMSVEVGDRILFSKYGYDEVKVGGVEYYIVGEGNVLAVITK